MKIDPVRSHFCFRAFLASHQMIAANEDVLRRKKPCVSCAWRIERACYALVYIEEGSRVPKKCHLSLSSSSFFFDNTASYVYASYCLPESKTRKRRLSLKSCILFPIAAAAAAAARKYKEENWIKKTRQPVNNFKEVGSFFPDNRIFSSDIVANKLRLITPDARASLDRKGKVFLKLANLASLYKFGGETWRANELCICSREGKKRGGNARRRHRVTFRYYFILEIPLDIYI